jgi:hypothetical protein
VSSVDPVDSAQVIVDPKDAAEAVGLRYVSDARPGISRKKAGSGFTYCRADRSRLVEPDVLGRIRALAVPPRGQTSGFAPTLTATSRPRAATRKAASSTVITRASERYVKARNTVTSLRLPMHSLPFGRKCASTWRRAGCLGKKCWQPLCIFSNPP